MLGLYLEVLSVRPKAVICFEALSTIVLWHRAQLAILVFELCPVGRRGWPQRCPELLWRADACLLDVLCLVKQINAHATF